MTVTRTETDIMEGRKEGLEEQEGEEEVEKQEGKEGVEKPEERENLLQRIKTRFSKRSKKANSEGTERKGKGGNNVENSQPEASLNIGLKEESKEVNNELTSEDLKGEDKDTKEGEGAEKKSDVMKRLKTRLSFRGNKDKKDKLVSEVTQNVAEKELVDNGPAEEKDVSAEDKEKKKAKKKKGKKEKVEGKGNDDVKEEGLQDNGLSKKDIIGTKDSKKDKVDEKKNEGMKNKSEKKIKHKPKEIAKEGQLEVCADEKENAKTENLFLRTIRRFSLKKKKGKVELEVPERDLDDKSADQKATEASAPVTVEEPCVVPPTEKARPQSMVVAGCRPPPGPGGGRPPIPRGRNTPSSASTQQNRTVSDLDSALRQFKLSTAASRESLRALGSTQDLTEVESCVRAAVSRSVSRQGSLRRGALQQGASSTGLSNIPITLSVSLQELRAQGAAA